MSIININAEKKAEIDRKLALDSANTWFAEQTNIGYTTQYGWKLGLKENDITLLTGAFVLAKEASSAGLPLPPIVDTDGISHNLTLEELTVLMLNYGQYRANLSAEYSNRLPR
jgi:hypothetical protein